MPYTYHSNYRNLNLNTDELIAEFESRELTVPLSLIDLRENGCRYAHQDFDVIGQAVRALAGGNDYEHVYVEIFERRYSETREFSPRNLKTCYCGHRRIGHIQGFGACLHFLSANHGANCDCRRFELTLTTDNEGS